MSGRILPVVLPDGFDPTRDRAKLEAKVRRVKGGNWTLTSIDPQAGRAYFADAASVTTIIDNDGCKGARLPADVKPSDGAKQAALLAEAFDTRYPGQGWTMTVFDPYRRRAVMERLDPDELRAREALAAALGVRPWEVRVRGADGGGFDVDLPPSYVPSRHDARLGEAVTTVIGRPGWYLRTDAAALTMRIRPGELPTFPTAIPYPFDAPVDDVWSIPLGEALGEPGRPNTPVPIDFDGVPGLLSTGTAGSGKSVGVNSLITGALLRGWELVVVDAPHKAVDFLWCRDLCRPGGWGCDSKEQALTALDLAYERGQEIARLLKARGAQKAQDLPPKERPRPILIVVDEATALFMLEPVPRGIPKDHPLVVEAVAKNLVTQTLVNRVAAIPAEMRFAGLRIVVSTQMAQAKTGFGGPLKANLAHRVLWGANPSESARGFALSDPRGAPRVPEWIRSDEAAARGVGVAELEDGTPTVVKGYFATTAQMRAHLLDAGVPRCERPEPTAAQVAAHTPSLDDTADSPRAPSRLEIEGGFGDVDDTTGADGLKGAARAAHELAASAAAASRRPATGRGSR